MSEEENIKKGQKSGGGSPKKNSFGQGHSQRSGTYINTFMGNTWNGNTRTTAEI
jgi:hypothetical protein